MKVISFILLSILIPNCIFGQKSQIVVVKPSAQTEAQYVWKTVCDINFFDKNGYSVSLPKHRYINKIVTLVHQMKLPDSAYDSLQLVMDKTIFDTSDYQKGITAVNEAIPTISKALDRLYILSEKWNFKVFPTYNISLTLYGPGGSYDSNSGTVLLQTSTDGHFKGYDNPAYTIIHEMVHIGIEQPIVERFHLPHPIKEQIVDLLVSMYFKDLLPLYRIQPMGNRLVEEQLQTKEDFDNLPKKVEQLVVQLNSK